MFVTVIPGQTSDLSKDHIVFQGEHLESDRAGSFKPGGFIIAYQNIPGPGTVNSAGDHRQDRMAELVESLVADHKGRAPLSVDIPPERETDDHNVSPLTDHGRPRRPVRCSTPIK